jgi:hypothetical protein
VAKRAKKPTKKKRPQPWLEAARAKLRANADARHEDEMSDAFLELAAPFIESLGPDADETRLGEVLQLVKIAWNLPIVHAASTEPGTEGARARVEVEAWLGSPPEYRKVLAPLIQARVEDFPHCGVLLAEVVVRRMGGHNAIALRFYGEEVSEWSVLDVEPSGWPKISHSLLALSQPARDLLTVPYGAADAQKAIDLAMVAWNLPVLDQCGALASEAVRRATLEAAQGARELPAPWSEVFEAMVTARATRFAYDPRLIMAAPAQTEGDMINVQAVAVHLERGARGGRC